MKDFRRDIAALQVALSDFSKSQSWILYDSDPYHFLVGMMALTGAGKDVFVSTKGQIPFIRASSYNTGFMGANKGFDLPPSISIREVVQQIETEPIKNSVVQCMDSESRGRVCFFTSGTTGQPKKVYKTADQLLAEIELFSSLWSFDGSPLFVSLVSHQHIYGLSFSYLLPLFCGASFYRYKSPGILGVNEPIEVDQFRELSYLKGAVVIASPTIGRMVDKIVQLREPQSITDGGRQLSISRVFSAGGRLSENDLNGFRYLFDCPVTEIFGSTETGAVASRQHLDKKGCGQDLLWAMLPGVNIKISDKISGSESRSLAVWGGHAGGSLQEPAETGDQVIIDKDGKFTLIGRLDRVQKVEGKRISLDEINDLVESSELVQESHTTVINRHNREGVAVCAVLSQKGLKQFREKGKFNIDRMLRHHLSQRLEPVTIPKLLHYVEEIPRTAQGKVTSEKVEELFNQGIQTILPQVNDVHRIDSELVLDLRIPVDLEYLKGHFNSMPVVPGVILLHWVYMYCFSHLHVEIDPTRVSRLKFSRIVQPGDRVKLVISISNKSASFRYINEENVSMSSGVVYLDKVEN